MTISVSAITNCNPSDPSGTLYTAEDVATVTVHKTMSAELSRNVALSNARLKGLTNLTFDTNVELQQRTSRANTSGEGTHPYIREDSMLYPKSLVIAKADGSVIPASQIVKIAINPASVEVTLAKGTFAGAQDAAGATVATAAFYHFGAGAAVPIAAGRTP